MATTTSIVTAVDNSLWNAFLADDGTTTRIRDGQAAVCTAFGNLSIPAGATIDGIEVDIEGTAAPADLEGSTGHWIYVSNDGGSSFSTAQSVTTGPWTAYGGADTVETAGGTSELWGETWNATTAAAIRVKLGWLTSNGDAVFPDYVLVRITYTAVVSTYTSDSTTANLTIKNGTLILNEGITTID